MGVTVGGAPPRPPESAPPVPIDPRIRARRIEVKREAGRQRLARLVDAGVVLAVAALFFGALWTPLLDVDEVAVSGISQLDAEAVREAAGISRGDPLISVDLHAAGERVAALPWVLEVEIERGVGGTVSLAVTEREPVASVGSGSSAVLVDREGRALGPADGTSVMPLTGVAAPAVGAFLPSTTADALALAEALAEAVPGAVASLDVETLRATLVQGGEVAFDDATKIDDKVRSLQTILAQVDLTCLALIDLTLPGNAVLTREEGCS